MQIVSSFGMQIVSSFGTQIVIASNAALLYALYNGSE